jgi:hypothetical protein
MSVFNYLASRRNGHCEKGDHRSLAETHANEDSDSERMSGLMELQEPEGTVSR